MGPEEDVDGLDKMPVNPVLFILLSSSCTGCQKSTIILLLIALIPRLSISAKCFNKLE